MKVAKDDRFKDMDSYFKIMSEQYEEFFTDPLTGPTNLKTVLKQMYGKLSLREMNTIIHLHNTASKDEVYG